MTSLQKMRVKSISAAPHIGLQTDNNRRVFHEGQTGRRFPPENGLSEQKDHTSKSRNITYTTSRYYEHPGELKDSDLNIGGRESKKVTNRGDNLPKESRPKRYYQTSNQRGSYSSPTSLRVVIIGR